jgi:hypothetical protein
MSSNSNNIIPNDIKNYIGDSTASKLEIFYNNTQDTIEKGFEKAFESLNTSLITTINSAFNTFESEQERRLEQNRENHEKAMSGLNSQYTTAQNFYSGNKDKQKAQTISIVDNFTRIKNNRMKAILFYALKKHYLKQRNLKNKHNNILNYFNTRKKFLIFNSWRNIANSFMKTKIKLINNQQFLEESKKITQSNEDEMAKLRLVLENLEKDIQKEINERKNLAKLYDLSLKKGVEAFLRETNYIIDFDASVPQTPNERSFIDAENNYKVYVQKANDIRFKTK